MGDSNRGFGAIRSIDYVIVLCDDLNRMKSFYKNVFDFRIEDEEDGQWAGFRVGTLFLCLRPRGRTYDGPKIPDNAAAIQLSFRVPPADVDIAHQTLRAKGIEIIEAPTNQDWPHRTLFFRDPEFNIIEIYADIHSRDTASASSNIHRVAEKR